MNRKVTIYTLAEELNVSPAAVSRAFNPSSRLAPVKRKMILDRAKKYNFTPNRAAARLSRRDIHIGVIITNRIPEFYYQMYSGVKAAEQELSLQKVTADIRVLMPGDDIVQRTLATLDEFNASHYDGVLVHGVYGDEIGYKIDELTNCGIAVATLHNDHPESRRLFNCSMNTEMSASMAAELLKYFIHDDKKNVVMFTGSVSSPIHQQLTNYFSKACRLEGLKLLEMYDTKDVPAVAKLLIAEAFKTFPDINGIYVSSANSISICEYLEEHNIGNKVTVITSDVFNALSGYIRRGVVNATLYQDPFSQGKNAFLNLYKSIAEGLKVPEKLMCNTQVVIKSNLWSFEKEEETKPIEQTVGPI